MADRWPVLVQMNFQVSNRPAITMNSNHSMMTGQSQVMIRSSIPLP
jgi:hypothetical protein